jgi:hypothetical protein
LVADHLNAGRPDQVELPSARRFATTQARRPERFKTNVVTRAASTASPFCQHPPTEHYFEGRHGLRIETFIKLAH